MSKLSQIQEQKQKLSPQQIVFTTLLQLNVDIGNRGEWTMKKNRGVYLVNTKKKPK